MPATSAGTSVLDATGYVTARRQATVSAKITGKVREVRIEEGQRVEAGEILATLDDSEARVEVALRQAQVGSGPRPAGRGGSGARQRGARVQARAGTGRPQVDQRLVARCRAHPVESLAARASSQQSAIKVAQEALQAARVQLDNTIVRAPFAGVVTVKAAQPGEMISPISAGGGSIRTGIGTIVDMDSLEIQVDVSEAYINRVQSGQRVEAVLNAYPEWRIPAEVIAIVPTADRSQGDGQGAHRDPHQGCAHRPGDGRARGFPREPRTADATRRAAAAARRARAGGGDPAAMTARTSCSC